MIVQQRMRLALLLAAAAVSASAAPARLPDSLESRNSMLAAAVRAGDFNLVTDLLNGGASPNTKDDNGTPVLMLSAIYGNSQMMQFLLDRGANPNATNKAGASAIHWTSGDPAKVRALVHKGADVNAKSGPGRTPLAIAAGQDNNFDIVKLLVDKGADVNAHDNLEGPVFTGGGGATPLIEAAKTRDARTVRFLIEHGAGVNAQDHNGATALTEAALRGSEEIVRILLDHGADPNHQMKAPYKSTPLVMAAIRASAPVIDLLLAKGAKVDAADGAGTTPLMWAAANEHASVEPVARLIAAGANVNTKNALGETPIVWASRRGNTPVVALLRKAGANTDALPSPAVSAGFIRTALDRPNTNAAIQRGLAVLDQGGPQFFKVSGCISCHNQTLPLMASALARANRGVEPDTRIEQYQLNSVLAFARPAIEIIAENTDVVPDLPVTGPNILEALAAQRYKADDLTAAIVHNIAAKQQKDGSWFGWAPRPPIESGDIQATALAIRAMQLYGPAGRKAEWDVRIAKARDWLRKANAVTLEEKVMKLNGLAWAKSTLGEMREATESLLNDQREDGSWAQLKTLPSDAYATGKALVALHQSAKISVGTKPYREGISYLLKTQKEDGSWQVTTRVFPFQPLKESGFPHGRDQWISAAGTSWALMALSLSAL